MLLEASHQLCLEESHPRDDSDEDVHAMSSDDDSLGSNGSTDGEGAERIVHVLPAVTHMHAHTRTHTHTYT